jgi:hypothetical protein
VSADVGDEKAEMRTIQAQHQAAGSRDIDYGFCLGRTGIFYEGRGWGIQDGATATGFGKEPDGNYYGREVTLCLLGNYELLTLSDAQVDRIREFIALAVDLEWLHVNPMIRGHRDVRATACPGQHAYDRLDDIKVPWKEDDLSAEDVEAGIKAAFELDKGKGDDAVLVGDLMVALGKYLAKEARPADTRRAAIYDSLAAKLGPV